MAYPTTYSNPNCGFGHVGIVDYGTRKNLSETWDTFCYRVKGRGQNRNKGSHLRSALLRCSLLFKRCNIYMIAEVLFVIRDRCARVSRGVVCVFNFVLCLCSRGVMCVFNCVLCLCSLLQRCRVRVNPGTWATGTPVQGTSSRSSSPRRTSPISSPYVNKHTNTP